MTITFEKPETELLIQQRLGDGSFRDAEEAILDALRSAPAPARRASGESLLAIFDELRAMTGGVDLDISRDRSAGRIVDFS